MICVKLAKIWSCGSFLPQIIAGKAAMIISRSVLLTHRRPGRQAGTKVMKQGQFSVEKLTHKFANFCS
jgi:hypothetical protein